MSLFTSFAKVVETPGLSRWYYAYGSNMNPERVSDRGLDFDRVVAGWVPGLGLRFNKQSKEHPHCGHANLVHAPGEMAEGVLYRLTNDDMIKRMDPFENAPINYSRECIAVQTRQGPILSWVYFANPAVLREGLVPSRDYLNHLLAGKPYLSADYHSRLLHWPVSFE